MNKFKYSFIVALAFSSIYCFAEDFTYAEVDKLEVITQDLKEINGKFYVPIGSVYVAPNSIFININGSMFPVTGISVDAEGVYFEEYQCVREGGEWRCKNCGYFNYFRSGAHAKCRNCRMRRSESGS